MGWILWRFPPLMALAAAICLVVGAACGGNDGAKEPAVIAALPPATGAGAPALPSDTPAAPSDETVPGDIETAARMLLAEELEADASSFRLDSSESVQWSDASLGCPEEGMMYAQVITPGYKLVFDFGGKSFAVHSNSDGSHMVVCGDWQ